MFDPKSKISNLRGKEYLEVKWRLVWFRDERKDGAILTDVVSTNPLMVKATVMDGSKVLSTGYGTAQVKATAVWNGREVEKAETAAIGRALAHAGYGTQFTDEDEGDNLADSPVEHKDRRPDLVARYNTLIEKAVSLNLSNIPDLDAGMSEEEIIKAGVELSDRIKKAGK
jgi:hypothetical protein